MIITGTVVSRSINKEGKYSSTIEIQDQRYETCNDTIHVVDESNKDFFVLGTKVKITIEEAK